MLTEANIRARLTKHFPGEQERQLSLVFNSIRADIASIVAWGSTLATKLNADGGVTDTNYAAPTVTSTGI